MDRHKWSRREWRGFSSFSPTILLLFASIAEHKVRKNVISSVHSFTPMPPVIYSFRSKYHLKWQKNEAVLRTVHKGKEGDEGPIIEAEGHMEWTSTARDKLQQHFSFPLDDWQTEAGGEILAGRNTIVCAPTGAGKTVVGEMALRIAFEDGMNSIYTTPLKALSNQKFMELRKMFGAENVGLSTGDISINRGARITVMTTEVYRNMAWRASSDSDEEKSEYFGVDDLVSNAVVVLDEFHYMGQPG